MTGESEIGRGINESRTREIKMYGIDESQRREFRTEAAGDVEIVLTKEEIMWLNDRIGGEDIQYDGVEFFPAIDVVELRDLRLKLASGFVAVMEIKDAKEIELRSVVRGETGDEDL